jgi:hypothetical protein
MYRLSLDDPRLFLPAPVYRVGGAAGGARYMLREGVEAAGCWADIVEAPFFAFPPDRARDGLVAVRGEGDASGTTFVAGDPPGDGRDALFLALPAEGEVPAGWALSPAVVPLYEYRAGGDGVRSYSTDPAVKTAGLVRSPRPVCRVWQNPQSVLVLDRDARPGPWPDG